MPGGRVAFNHGTTTAAILTSIYETKTKTLFLIWASLSVTLISSELVTASHHVQGERLRLIPNVYLSGLSSKTRTFQARSLMGCVSTCYTEPKCVSVSFKPADNTCNVNSVTLSSPKIVGRYDTDYVYIEITARVGWFLAFRATGGIQDGVYDAWNDVGRHDPGIEVRVRPDDLGCVTVDSSLPCPKHFRSQRLDDYSNVAKIKYGFYSKGKQRFSVTFKLAKNSNPSASFNVAKLVAPTTEILHSENENVTFVSAEGIPDCQCRFLISKSLDGDCAGHAGWTMVVDGGARGPSCCDYEGSGPFPKFYYTKTGDAVYWDENSTVGKADVFAVFFRYRKS